MKERHRAVYYGSKLAWKSPSMGLVELEKKAEKSHRESCWGLGCCYDIITHPGDLFLVPASLLVFFTKLSEFKIWSVCILLINFFVSCFLLVSSWGSCIWEDGAGWGLGMKSQSWLHGLYLVSLVYFICVFGQAGVTLCSGVPIGVETALHCH